jgi:hypothetical protein
MKTLQFSSKKVLELYLELAHDRYANIVAHLEDIDMVDMEDHFVGSTSILMGIS